MGEESKIGWTDSTFNPWIGCAHASEGCTNCYAEGLMDSYLGRAVWGNAANSTRVRTTAEYWRKLLIWNEKAKKTGIRKRVFVASLADVFENRPELVPWRRDMLRLLEKVTSLQILMLTKRIGLVEPLTYEALGVHADEWFEANPHVALGTSIENQHWADVRIPLLGQIPASMRFLSVEPMIGPVDVGNYEGMFDWLIIGGESGREGPKGKIRELKLEDAEYLIEQGKRMEGVSVYFKQTGTVLARKLKLTGKGEHWEELPESLRVREWPD